MRNSRGAGGAPLCVDDCSCTVRERGSARKEDAEVVVAGRGRRKEQITITNRTEPRQAPTSWPWTTTASSTTEYALC